MEAPSIPHPDEVMWNTARRPTLWTGTGSAMGERCRWVWSHRCSWADRAFGASSAHDEEVGLTSETSPGHGGL